jgi:cytochrome P450
VLLSFVSANHDRSVWDKPESIDIHRERKPHLAFGFGRHSCMGMNITEHEAACFLEVFLERCQGWKIVGAPEIQWASASGAEGESVEYLDHFHSLRIGPSKRD